MGPRHLASLPGLRRGGEQGTPGGSLRLCRRPASGCGAGPLAKGVRVKPGARDVLGAGGVSASHCAPAHGGRVSGSQVPLGCVLIKSQVTARGAKLRPVRPRGRLRVKGRSLLLAPSLAASVGVTDAPSWSANGWYCQTSQCLPEHLLRAWYPSVPTRPLPPPRPMSSRRASG